MLLRLVLLFLVGMVVLSVLGKFRLTGSKKPDPKEVRKAKKCPHCGTWRIGEGPCACGRDT